MKIKTKFIITLLALILATPIAAQDTPTSGFVISLKNGSTIRGRTLTRDDSIDHVHGEGLDLFKSKLKAAGWDKVLAEFQKQADAYLAENK